MIIITAVLSIILFKILCYLKNCRFLEVSLLITVGSWKFWIFLIIITLTHHFLKILKEIASPLFFNNQGCAHVFHGLIIRVFIQRLEQILLILVFLILPRLLVFEIIRLVIIIKIFYGFHDIIFYTSSFCLVKWLLRLICFDEAKFEALNCLGLERFRL